MGEKPNPVKLVREGPAESPREVIERTRRLFGMRGTWVRGQSMGTSQIWDHRRCLIAGLRACDGVNAKKAEEIVLTSINEVYGVGKPQGGWKSIPTFNDAPGRTKEDIIKVLDHALEKGS